MNNKQMLARVKDRSSYVLDEQYIKIRVCSQLEDKTADDCFDLLDSWAHKTDKKIKIIRTASMGYYDLEPIIIVEKLNNTSVYYPRITSDAVPQFIKNCLDGDDIRSDLMLDMDNLPVFRLQNRVILHNCGYVDPESIESYLLECNGYTGFEKALTMSGLEIIEEIKRSGLRDWTGTCALAADKWKKVQDAAEKEKHVVVNAMDSNRDARTSQLLLEGDPHSVLEGALIAAYAVGASRCHIVIPAGNGRLKSALTKAISQARDYGLLGENILEAGFKCEIDIKQIEPSLPGGEDTAVLRALEDRQPLPYLLLSGPKFQSLNGAPALVENVETFTAISKILQGKISECSTKIITLAGDVAHPYSVEVPFGTTIGSLIEDIGGGVAEGSIKAFQFGGSTGSYFGVESFGMPINIDTISEETPFISFNTVNVISDKSCAVEMSQRLMEYLHGQSCGKCVFCRDGTLHMSHILADIVNGDGKNEDLEMLRKLGGKMLLGTICSFGQSAAKPVLSSLNLFENDYASHIKQKKCPLKQSEKEA